MNLELKVPCNDDKLLVILRADMPEKDGRAKMSFSRTKDAITVKITALDAIAMRSSINSVLKTLAVYEKTKDAIR